MWGREFTGREHGTAERVCRIRPAWRVHPTRPHHPGHGMSKGAFPRQHRAVQPEARVNVPEAVNSSVESWATSRLAFPDHGQRVRIRASTHAPPGRRAWILDADVSATRSIIAFMEKYVTLPEPFFFLLPSGEIVEAHFDGELSVSEVAAGAWKVAPFRMVEAYAPPAWASRPVTSRQNGAATSAPPHARP